MRNSDSSLPAVMWETGSDEAFLVGSEGELRQFAQNILALLEELDPEEDFLGTSVRWGARYLTEEFGDAAIVSIAVTTGERVTKELINAIRMNNGESAVAWPPQNTDK